MSSARAPKDLPPSHTLVPAFAPAPTPDDPPPAEQEPGSSPPPAPASPPEAPAERRLRGLLSPRPDRSGTRTPTSVTTGERDGPAEPVKVDPETMAAIVAGILGLAALAAAGVVSWRTRRARRLRQPTDADLAAVAAPLTKMALRKATMLRAAPDLVDVIEAVGAAGRYVTAGPLTEPVPPAAGQLAAHTTEETPQ